jgi:hypothetical protein
MKQRVGIVISQLPDATQLQIWAGEVVPCEGGEVGVVIEMMSGYSDE